MSRLPKQFAELDEKWGSWIVEGEHERAVMRERIPDADLREFYDDVMLRLDEILLYLDEYSPETLPEDAQNLWWLTSSFIGVGMVVEVYGSQDRIPGAYLLAKINVVPEADSIKFLQ